MDSFITEKAMIKQIRAEIGTWRSNSPSVQTESSETVALMRAQVKKVPLLGVLLAVGLLNFHMPQFCSPF